MRRAFLMMLAALLAAACGGGGGGFALGPGDGGVGSGGTGAVAVVASGPVEGFGSIIVNGTRYDTDNAHFDLRDAPALRLGMTVEVRGTVSDDLRRGVASVVTSSAQLRGVPGALAANGFVVAGVRVLVDGATVIADPRGLSALAGAPAVLVWGLPQDGALLATRVELGTAASAAQQVLTDAIHELDTDRRSFRLGNVRVVYAPQALRGWASGNFAEGKIAQVRGAVDATGTLNADSIEPAEPESTDGASDAVLSLSGRVNQSDGQRFRLGAYTVDASAAQLTGGTSLADGARVEVLGTLRADRVLAASRIGIRQSGPGNSQAASSTGSGSTSNSGSAPGTSGTSTASGASDGASSSSNAGESDSSGTGTDSEYGRFSLHGSIGAFRSDASFSVRGQAVDASGANVQFIGGTRASLQAGRMVIVSGSRVRGDVLLADRVEITP